ncbi:phosphatidylinositol synthase 1 (CDP-alcohol phosphatidyltransferase1) [Coemansia erecta]|uniref:CDP-diacylglycerol--inositol 3-phosphatidyltransferase n=1 Tax=Coemansia erecta TaxID=147472 RepID=A0A9W8CQU8_9FUNG|nr:phosphatidylinositol synthase 1 (CDP-alcohol phosphatidyltransferase1) [Coemansia erecta]
MLTHNDVFWFVPNLIGYSRVFLTAVAGYSMFASRPVLMTVSYALSELLDAADGHYARKLNQCSKFGEVLDMVTDRCTTTILLTYLTHLYPMFAVPFAFLVSLDVSSHYMQMYAQLITGKTNHKQMDEGKHWVLRAYYTDRRVLFAFCFGNEAFFLLLYVIAYLSDVAQVVAIVLCVAMFPLFAIKNIINVIQLCESAKDLAKLDADQLNKDRATKSSTKKKAL